MTSEDEIEKWKRMRIEMAEMDKDKRREIAETCQWEVCIGCGKSAKDYFIETGYDMLIWHPEPGPMCIDCYEDYDDD